MTPAHLQIIKKTAILMLTARVRGMGRPSQGVEEVVGLSAPGPGMDVTTWFRVEDVQLVFRS